MDIHPSNPDIFIYGDTQQIWLTEDGKNFNKSFQSKYPPGPHRTSYSSIVFSPSNPSIVLASIRGRSREAGGELYVSNNGQNWEKYNQFVDVITGEKILSESVFASYFLETDEILFIGTGDGLAIIDETYSGLDIDALKIVANGVNTLRNKKRSFLIITHYQRLLDYIKPDFVHVLMNGKIIKSGCMELAEELEKVGYEKL